MILGKTFYGFSLCAVGFVRRALIEAFPATDRWRLIVAPCSCPRNELFDSSCMAVFCRAPLDLCLFRAAVHQPSYCSISTLAPVSMSGLLLAGKSAIITGGVTGISRAIALEFLSPGAAVTVNHLDDDASRQHFKLLQAEAPNKAQLLSVAGDIGKRATGTQLVDAAVQAHSGLDCFVANAGVSQFRDFLT